MDSKEAQKLESEAREAGVDYVRFTMTDMNGLMRGKTAPIGQMRRFLEDGMGIYKGTAATGCMGGFYPETMDSKEAEKLENEACKAGVDHVRFTLTDMHGLMRGKTAPIGQMRRFLEDGMGIYKGTAALSCMGHFLQELSPKYPDCLMVAEKMTFRRVPWGEVPGNEVTVGEVQCENRVKGTGECMKTTPRYVARQLLEQLKDKFGYTLYFSSELEFMLFKMPSFEPLFPGRLGYIHAQTNEVKRYMFTLEKHLHTSGIALMDWMTEYSAGQLEVALEPEVGIGGADTLALSRHAIKETAMQSGLTATFMTSVSADADACNGSHFNHSLQDVHGKNVFSDVSRPRGLSQVAGYWLAGLLEHGPALAALCCPTINCYRRHGSVWVPTHSNWGVEDRNMFIRAKNFSTRSTYFESRLPSGAANPYLVVAGHVAAGIDGLKRQLPLPDENHTAATKLPITLKAALDALKSDEVILQALGKEFVEWFLVVKGAELNATLHDITDKTEDAFKQERDMYMNL